MPAGVRRIKANRSIEGPTIDNQFEKFASEKTAAGLVPKTIQNYWESVKRFSLFVEGTGMRSDMSCISKTCIEPYFRSLQGQGLSVQTINHYLRDIRTFAYWHQDHAGMDQFVVKLLPKGQKKPKVYSQSDLVAIMHKPKPNASFAEFRTWMIACFVFATAARIGSVCALKIEDIDFNANEVPFTHTKNKKEQPLSLTPKIKAALIDCIRVWRHDAGPKEYLFCNVGGEQLSENAEKHAFYDYAKKRGSSKTSMHAIRQTFAKPYIQAHGDLFRLQAIRNHSTLEMTREYIEMFGSALHDGFAEMNPLERFQASKQPESKTALPPAPCGAEKNAVTTPVMATAFA